MTMQLALHLKDDIDRFYVSRKEKRVNYRIENFVETKGIHKKKE